MLACASYEITVCHSSAFLNLALSQFSYWSCVTPICTWLGDWIARRSWQFGGVEYICMLMQLPPPSLSRTLIIFNYKGRISLSPLPDYSKGFVYAFFGITEGIKKITCSKFGQLLKCVWCLSYCIIQSYCCSFDSLGGLE